MIHDEALSQQVRALAEDLVARQSVTPEDAGCQDKMVEYLAPLGFELTCVHKEEVKNIWLKKGLSDPLLVFAGHTDVVPVGDLPAWKTDPFKLTEQDGQLYGRGIADMKGAIAAFMVATKSFIESHPEHNGSIAFLITSDEEGPAKHGTKHVVNWLAEQGRESICWCVIGEPSSTKEVGDMIKNGRRGSLGFELTVKGIQGHIAYPHLAKNPIHEGLASLKSLVAESWDQGNASFPPTSFQISNINSGTGTTNVIPGHMKVVANFRYSTELTHERIQERVLAILAKHELDYSISWQHYGEPFLTDEGPLIDAAQQAVEAVTGEKPALSTTGGTSDGRFIAKLGCEVVELGLVNQTIHQVNERIDLGGLETLTKIYYQLLVKLLCQHQSDS